MKSQDIPEVPDSAVAAAAPCSPRQTFHCDFGIRSIQKGKKGKPATMTVEIHNDLADKLMRGITGIGPRIYGPVIEWQEDAADLGENMILFQFLEKHCGHDLYYVWEDDEIETPGGTVMDPIRWPRFAALTAGGHWSAGRFIAD